MLDAQQLEVISSRAHLAAELQSLEASLRGNKAEGPERGKRGRKGEDEKNRTFFAAPFQFLVASNFFSMPIFFFSTRNRKSKQSSQQLGSRKKCDGKSLSI